VYVLCYGSHYDAHICRHECTCSCISTHDCSVGYVQDGSEDDDANGMDDDSLSDWNLSKLCLCLMCVNTVLQNFGLI